LPIVPNVPDGSSEPQDSSTDATLPVQSTPLDATLPNSSDGRGFDAAGFDGALRDVGMDAGKDAGVSELYRLLPADPVTCGVSATIAQDNPKPFGILASLLAVLTFSRRRLGRTRHEPPTTLPPSS
jgi:hypothetical protein